MLALTAACGDSTSQPTTSAGSTDAGSSGTAAATTGGTTEAPGTSTTDAPTTSASTTNATSASTTSPVTATDPGSSGGTTGDPIDHYLEAEPLFAFGKIAEFDLTLPDTSVLSLTNEPKNFTLGDLKAKIDGQTYDLPSIGVRLKGNVGSFRELSQKAAFLFDFDRYTADQDLLGLTKLAVNNMVQDCSMQREILAYELFRDMGVPAPRAGYATVRVNGELYGLYTLVESADNKHFLKHWYGDNDGTLYEGAYGSDIQTDLIPSFDQDNGPDVALTDLFEFAAALDSFTDPKKYATDVAAILDLPNYLAFSATEIYLGHWDGYAWTKNNFFVHRRTSDMKWQFMPWGTDQTLRDHLDPFGGDGRLQMMCDASQPCRDQLAVAFGDAIDRAAALDLAGKAMQLSTVTAAAFAADPRKECNASDHTNSINGNIDFLNNRPNSVMDGLKCTNPGLVDNDKDGYSACIDDCNDNDAKVHPNAPEVCDLDDDNCNGIWDDDPKCPQCVNKDLPGPGTADFCFVGKNYLAAEAACLAKGGKMLSIHSLAIQDWTKTTAFAIANKEWWIGLDDIDQEGTFKWSDGTPLDYTYWNDGEPNNAGNEDCANLPPWTGGRWNDLPCDHVQPYVCRMP